MTQAHHADVVIVGSGMGGGTLTWALRDCGAKVLLLERGKFLASEPQNWSAAAVFGENRYKAKEEWRDAAGGWFSPGVHYFVGGNTKVYGAALPRLRQADFGEIQHAGGLSPAWPISYEDLAPYYDRAERLFWVHGEAGADPTDPPRSGPFPFPPMPPDPDMEIWTDTFVSRVLTDPSGLRATGMVVERDGERVLVEADIVVIASGAVNSAALLLRSATDRSPNGLANSSGLVGRNYMVHTNSVLVAIDPRRPNPTVFQKTISVNDFYHAGIDAGFPFPMGNLQPVGKLQGVMMRGAAPHAPEWSLRAAAQRSVDWWVMSEDLPDRANRATLDSSGNIVIHWRPNNLAAHDRLMGHAKSMLRRAGYPVLLDQRMGIATNSHQCGTLRFGHDARRSVLDPYCRAHDLDNLYVVDASFFPSSAAVNPALTIAAQALRVGDHLQDRLGVAASPRDVEGSVVI